MTMRRIVGPHKALAVVGVALLSQSMAGCRDTASVVRAVDVDTLSGVVVVRNRPLDPDRPPAGWVTRLLFRIGSVDGQDGGITIGQVGGLEIDNQGRVYVLDRRSRVIRVIGPDGTHLFDLGGTGDGPGEFRDPDAVVITPDGMLWVRDRRSRRYTAFTGDGTVAGTYRRLTGGGGDPVASHDGVIYEAVTRLINVGHPNTRDAERFFYAVTPVEDVMVPIDTLYRPAPVKGGFWTADFASAGGNAFEGGPVDIPFFPERMDYVDPRGGFWTGTTDALRFVHLDPNGDTVRVVERSAVPRPVSMGAKREAIEGLKRRFGERLQIVESEIPEHFPFWQSFFVDDTGHLWIQRYPTPTESATKAFIWEIYDNAGVYLGILELPFEGDPVPAFRAGRMAGVVRDELDVEYVVVLELLTGSNR